MRHIKGQEYKDDETIQYEANKKQTKKAIWISFGVGIGSIFVGVMAACLTYCQNERHHKESMSLTQKIIVVHDTIIKSKQSMVQRSNNIIPNALNNSLKPTVTIAK